MRIKKCLAFTVMLFLCLGLIALIAQETTREGWQGFYRITQVLERTETAINQVYNEFVVLKKLKVNIIDDTALLTEVVKVIDVYPDYTVAGINQRINAYEAEIISLIEAGLIEDSMLQVVTSVEAGYIYAGYAIHFTGAGETKWKIKRAAEPEPGEQPIWTWAEGTEELKYAWSNRTGLSY